MSTRKVIRLIVVVVILGISVWVLLWACLPTQRQIQIVPVNPANLQLPTPEGFIPLCNLVI